MKKNLRFILAAVACFALVGTLALVGCAQPAEQETTEPEATTQEDTPSADAETHEPVELQIFAANSLTKAMDDVQALYREDHDWVTFADTQYKSSGELNELLAGGAYADVLISASKGKMDDAEAAGHIDPASRFDLFKNDLVMVTAEGSDIADVTLDDIATGAYTVSLGDESVPAGNYACQSLYTVGCYSDESGQGGQFTGALAGDGAVVLDSSVGNVCKHAEAGDVDIAFVYTSDVYRFGGVKIAGVVPEDTHKKIIYPAALTSQTTNSEEAAAFLEWAVTDPGAIKLWQEWGFELVA